ncbi:MAG TPA: nuclear transport factor 2 family protein [Gemmatimonadaceae bacterium]|nr:nuclear transport factor 2 family protein [Gemmatimonadaceae bacterium]
MKRPLGHGVVFCAILLSGCTHAGVPLRNTPSDLERTDRAVNAEIEAVLQQYVRAVNNADPNLLREIWDTGTAASYVNPTQRLRTWEQLERFWRGFLGDRFSVRKFTPDSVAIRHVGDVAWVVFNWEFRATQRNGEPYNQHGWEPQVYLRSDRGWRIAHAHYSALALRQ